MWTLTHLQACNDSCVINVCIFVSSFSRLSLFWFIQRPAAEKTRSRPISKREKKINYERFQIRNVFISLMLNFTLIKHDNNLLTSLNESKYIISYVVYIVRFFNTKLFDINRNTCTLLHSTFSHIEIGYSLVEICKASSVKIRQADISPCDPLSAERYF